MHRYFIEFGRHPAISLAEVLSVAKQTGIELIPDSYHNSVLCLSVKDELPASFFKKLGGSLRIGSILKTHPGVPIEEDVIQLVSQHLNNQPGSKKMHFGLSAAKCAPGARLPSSARLRAWGLSIKKKVKANRSVRLVTGKTDLISPVAIEKNKMHEYGGDYIILVENNQWHIARTEAVHAFEDDAKREFSRPASDPKSGMIPVKLARMMINLLGDTSQNTILDPFCGTGTILGEAMILGWEEIVGSDNSESAISASEKNLNWLKTEYNLPQTPKLFLSSVEKISNNLKPKSINAIVTEPFLGPPLYGNAQKDEIQKNVKKLQALYTNSLKELRSIIKDSGRAVCIFPFFINQKIGTVLSDQQLSNLGWKRVSPLPVIWQKKLNKHLSLGGNLFYSRPDARVGREIVILEPVSR